VDNPSHESLRRFGPSRPIAGLIFAAALLTAGAAIFSDDRGGRLFLGCVAVALVAIAATDLMFWPRLSAGPTGLAVFAPSVRARLTWAEIDTVRVDERSHLGLASRALEIEAGPRLIVLSRWGLGRDPREVLAELQELRPTR
jgi:hypothetical protein